VEIPKNRSTHVRRRKLFSELYSENTKGRFYSDSHKPEDDIKVDLKLVVCEDVELIFIAHYRENWKAFVNTVTAGIL
jgi:hypothetical protein